MFNVEGRIAIFHLIKLGTRGTRDFPNKGHPRVGRKSGGIQERRLKSQKSALRGGSVNNRFFRIVQRELQDLKTRPFGQTFGGKDFATQEHHGSLMNSRFLKHLPKGHRWINLRLEGLRHHFRTRHTSKPNQE